MQALVRVHERHLYGNEKEEPPLPTANGLHEMMAGSMAACPTACQRARELTRGSKSICCTGKGLPSLPCASSSHGDLPQSLPMLC